jgi:peroxiredoxin
LRPAHWLLLIVAAAAGLGGGWAVQYWGAADDGMAGPASDTGAGGTGSILGMTRPGFTLPDLDGEPVDIADFDGRILVINFWATWCPPCVEEIPMLIDLQRDLGEHDVQVIGVAVEGPEPVRAFAADFGIDYPVLVSSREGFDLVAEYGNSHGTLPYTVFVGRDGLIRGVHNGLLSRQQAEARLEPLLDG